MQQHQSQLSQTGALRWRLHRALSQLAMQPWTPCLLPTRCPAPAWPAAPRATSFRGTHDVARSSSRQPPSSPSTTAQTPGTGTDHSRAKQTGGPEPAVDEPRAEQRSSSHHTSSKLAEGPGHASAPLRCKDCRGEDDDSSPSKQRLVLSCLTPFELHSHLSDPGTKRHISPSASFIPSFQAPVFMSHLQSLQLLPPNLPLQSELPIPLSSSTISSD